VSRRGSLRGTVTNWRSSDAPLGAKLRQFARNNWLKLKRRQSCCGHDGEVGC
jgi:hypothetical protein